MGTLTQKAKDDRLAAILQMRNDGRTYQQIADSIGLTRQRIHQLLRDAGAANGRLPVVPKVPICGFVRSIRRFMFIAGYTCCHHCKTWKCLLEFGAIRTGMHKRCRDCQAAMARLYRHHEPSSGSRRGFAGMNLEDANAARARGYVTMRRNAIIRASQRTGLDPSILDNRIQPVVK